MRVLLVLLVAVVGVAWAVDPPRVSDACDILTLPFEPVQTSIIVTDNSTGYPVRELKNEMVIKVEVALPADPTKEYTEVYCLLGIGLGLKWRRIMAADSCVTARADQGKATCIFPINGVGATQDETVDLKIGVKYGDGILRTKLADDLSFKYGGPKAGTTPPTPAPKTTTTIASITEKVKVDDPHDSKMEAYLAAKWAEEQQQMANDEDKNSEGDWQKLEEDEKRQHDQEMQKEVEEYETRQAEESRRREEMIRREMMDKEENERIENEFKRTSSTLPPTARPDSQQERVEEEEVEVNNNGIVALPLYVDSGAARYAGLGTMLVLVVSMVAAILV